MNRPFDGLRAGEAAKIFGRSSSQDGVEDEFAVILCDGERLERSAQGPEFGPDLGATKQTAQTIDMRRKDVSANVRSEMVVADELANSRKDFSSGRNQ